MSQHEFQKPRVPKRFYFLNLLVFIPVFFFLSIIQAHWYGYAVTVLAFALLMWIRHTPAWYGWHVPLCFVLALIVTYGGLYFSRPRWDVSLPGQMSGGLVRVFLSLPVDESVKSGETFGEVSVWKPAEGNQHEVIQLPNFKLEKLARTGSTSEYAFLQLHGGAFAVGMNDLYRRMAEKFCDLSGGAAVYTPDYRLYPAYPYPSQQNDAMDAWVYLTKTLGYAPDHIILTGDSAGGNLVLNLGLRLRDAGEGMPKAIIAMSPWADLSNSGPSHYKNATLDPSFGKEPDKYDGVSAVGVDSHYADGLNAQDAYLSPSFGDYSGFPPMLLQAGEIEVLLSDSQMVHDNAVKNSVDCTFTVYPGMFHVFQGSLELLPESREAWNEITAFVKRVLSDAQAQQ